jgi:hypothetical protein
MQTQKLSSANVKTLEQNLGVTRKLVIFVAVGLVVLVLLSPSMIQGINSSIVVPAILLLIGFFVWAINRMGGNIQKDLKNGVKQMITAKVEDKLLGNSNSFVLVVNGERELVTKEHYDSVLVGDQIELEKAPLSRTLLALKKVEN